MADRLRKARTDAELDQVAMAKACRVARTTIGNYESGRTEPGYWQLHAWADACQVPVEWLDPEGTIRCRCTAQTPGEGRSVA